MTVESFRDLIPATRKKAELEQFLDALGWVWNKEISRELGDCIQTIEADNGHERN